MTILRWTGYTLVALEVALLLGSMRLGLWNPSYAAIMARQATPPSKFVMVGDDKFMSATKAKAPHWSCCIVR